MSKLKDLMALERILLEIDAKHKFELEFCDAYKLYEYLKTVGKITSYAFLIQDEFNQKYNNLEALKEYHNKINDGSVDFSVGGEIIAFIDKINEQLKDEELNNLILNIGWW